MDMQIAARLPKPLATLFEKLKVFAASYQQFSIKIKVKGAQTSEGLDQDAIDECYRANEDCQLLYNLANQARVATSSKGKDVNIEKSKARTRMPGISDHSKRIKKEKKTIIDGKEKMAPTDELQIQQNQVNQLKAEGSLEEGEEGMLSEADLSNSGQEDSDFNDKPPVMKLLGKYDKYVEYIDVLIERPGTFCDQYTTPFSASCKYAINEILTSKSKEEISLAAFPLRLRFFLVPALDILTV